MPSIQIQDLELSGGAIPRKLKWKGLKAFGSGTPSLRSSWTWKTSGADAARAGNRNDNFRCRAGLFLHLLGGAPGKRLEVSRGG